MSLKLSLFSGIALIAFAAQAFTETKIPQAQDPYFKSAAEQLAQRMALVPNTGKAKNVILMIGDGMGIPMITARRIYDGEKKKIDGVSNKLAFEIMPYSALSRTYSADAQVTDSAPLRYGDKHWC